MYCVEGLFIIPKTYNKNNKGYNILVPGFKESLEKNLVDMSLFYNKIDIVYNRLIFIKYEHKE